jgi:hypothetical protein
MSIVNKEAAPEWYDEFRLGPVQDRLNGHRGVVSLTALELELKPDGGCGYYRAESVKRVEDVHYRAALDFSAWHGLKGRTETALLRQDPSRGDTVRSVESGNLDPREPNLLSASVLNPEVAVKILALFITFDERRIGNDSDTDCLALLSRRYMRGRLRLCEGDEHVEAGRSQRSHENATTSTHPTTLSRITWVLSREIHGDAL